MYQCRQKPEQASHFKTTSPIEPESKKHQRLSKTATCEKRLSVRKNEASPVARGQNQQGQHAIKIEAPQKIERTAKKLANKKKISDSWVITKNVVEALKYSSNPATKAGNIVKLDCPPKAKNKSFLKLTGSLQRSACPKYRMESCRIPLYG